MATEQLNACGAAVDVSYSPQSPGRERLIGKFRQLDIDGDLFARRERARPIGTQQPHPGTADVDGPRRECLAIGLPDEHVGFNRVATLLPALRGWLFGFHVHCPTFFIFHIGSGVDNQSQLNESGLRLTPGGPNKLAARDEVADMDIGRGPVTVTLRSFKLSSLKQRLRVLRGRSGSGSSDASGARGLRISIADLEKLNHSTEQDFLAVGGKLMQFRSAAQQISSDMAALSKLISGESGRKACDALSSLLEHSRDMDSRIEQGGQALISVCDLSIRLRQAFSGLPQRVSVFRTLCTLTRIETTRLGGAGVDFGNLAEEVKPLSERIQSGGENVLETASELDRDVQSALRKGSDLQAKELKDLHALIARVLGSLNSFEERRQRAREVSAEQASQYASMCEAIENLVQSVQFHDITRQQVEHIIKALRECNPAAADIRVILSLQCSQLTEAARVFASSVSSIEHALDAIAVRVRDMAEASRTLTGMSGADQNSFFLEMEGSLSSILAAAGASNATAGQIRAMGVLLRETVRRMQESIAETRGTEISIERIAINATIRATQIGEAGSALNVVAEVMRGLALDSNRNTEEVAGALGAMLDAVNRLYGGAGDEQDVQEERIFDETRSAILELHSSSDESARRLNQIAALGARLAQDIGSLRSGFAAGRIFAEVAGSTRGTLERIGAQTGQVSVQDSGAETAQQLERFAQTYTMQRQRDVHESVLAGTAITPTEAPQVAASQTELGANVELF